MFFLASKTIGALLVPSNFMIMVGAIGLVLICTRCRRLGRRLVVTCVAALLVCGLLPIGPLLLVPLETRFPPWTGKNGEPTGIIVLGGPIDPILSAAYGTPVLGGSADRIVVAAQLALQYPKARIVLAGGNPNLIENATLTESDYAALEFERLGIAHDRLQLDRTSRNTEENARFSKAIAAPKSTDRWLLVTSAFHMPRAIGIFRKIGFVVEPCPVDWKTRGWRDLIAVPGSFTRGLSLTDVAVHEWIGLAVYYVTGKTSELFPSPKASQN